MNYVIGLLLQKGYRFLKEERKDILFRETADKVYVLLVSGCSGEIDTEQYSRVKEQAVFLAVTRFGKDVEVLCLILTPDGMFEDEVIGFVEKFSGVWLLTLDTGRLYVFENQPARFDDLEEYLEQGMKKRRKDTSDVFSVTPVNMVLVACNIVYFIIIIVLNHSVSAVYDTDCMLRMGALSYELVATGQWYRIITSIFMHFGFSHLFNNMVLLTYMGCELEKRIGHISYLILYFITGISGNLVSLWYYHHIGDSAVCAGASGAIFGVIGALFAVLLCKRTETQNLSARRIAFMVIFTIGYGFTTLGVDNAAHIGGLFTGVIGGFLLSKISQYGKLEEVRFMR
jgi:rhomboid protease GluP